MKEKLFILSFLLFTFAAQAVELPEGYTAIEYLTAPNRSYVDTGYIHKPSTRVECVLSAAESQSSITKWMALFGACKGDKNNNAFAFFLGGDDNLARYNRSGSEEKGAGYVFPREVKTTLVCDGLTAMWTAGGETTSPTEGGRLRSVRHFCYNSHINPQGSAKAVRGLSRKVGAIALVRRA